MATRSNTATAILIMLTGLLAMTLMDSLSKWLTQYYSPFQVGWSRYVGQLVLVLVILRQRITVMARTHSLGSHLGRSLFQIGATLCFFTALSKIPLAEASAIASINPVLITLGAGLFLGEKLGPRRLIGVAVAMVGAMIIIRPGMAEFSGWYLLPLCTAVCYSGYTLMTRKMGAAEPFWTSLFYAAIVGSVIMSAIAVFVWKPVPMIHWLPFAGIGLLGAAGQLCVIRAFSLAEASAISPFAYVGLIIAAVWGYLFFGETPDLISGVGALVIVGAGLYVWHRETQAAKDRQEPHDQQSQT